METQPASVNLNEVCMYVGSTVKLEWLVGVGVYKQ